MRWGAIAAAFVVAGTITPASGAPRDRPAKESCNALLQRVQNEHEASRAEIAWSTEGPEDAALRARNALLSRPPCDSKEARRAGRCQRVERGIGPPEVGWDPASSDFRKGRHCAVVTVLTATWNSVVQESDDQERTILGLAAGLAKRVGGRPLHLQPTQWEDGRSAGNLGAFLDAQLRSGLAKAGGGETTLVPAGVWQSDAPVVRLLLDQSGDQVLGSVEWRDDLHAQAARLEGLAFASDLFDTSSDGGTGTADLQPRLAKSTSDAPCEGSEEHNRVTFRGRGTVFIFSVAEATGETWLVERSDGPVDGEYVTPDPIRLVTVSGFEEGERLIAAVVPEGSNAGAWTEWRPTCVVPGKFDPTAKAVGGAEFFLAEPIKLRRTVEDGCSAKELPSEEERAEIAQIVERLRRNVCGR